MSLSMYQSSVPVFVHALRNLSAVLRKGEAHVEGKGVTGDVLLQTRLIPDMMPLVRQVQIATDIAKNGAARLAGVDPLKFEDNETSFEQLYARIDRAVDYIGSFSAEQLDGSEARPIVVPSRTWGDRHFEGRPYLLDFVLPNLFFHTTTAYAIVRQAGTGVGKADFLGLS
ncbi:DUF1993 domain-containing protein [Montanilutibacter psychrotolerans]|uniref:DUF1993 domain-containing protein n=1 Tax=Montanilutibacter psychrotolerans TaxID=1327343 RepID=A0A3M8SYA3_9GAMM|nr:DUF1993 domain-containing protein [Lysobacter psychrotolerans]RNF84426.1 DUF1993 domain-containing protein [Lysobacter psychrotolerans]